jgi:hypothetical protein
MRHGQDTSWRKTKKHKKEKEKFRNSLPEKEGTMKDS